MQNTFPFQTQSNLDSRSLLLASLILREVHRVVGSVHVIAAVLLRYVATGFSIANSLIELIVPTESEQN
jgi:hypothetical protein